MDARKMPIGIQDFEDLRAGGYVYVDKTAYMHKLVTEGKPYFLGRPRRFGKSLLLSTLKAYFLGKKQLFEGGPGEPRLAIADLEKDWTAYPVFHIDLIGEQYRDSRDLETKLDSILRELEEDWGRDSLDSTPGSRFRSLIRRACEQSGKRVVVLIDEYDKPMLQNLEQSKNFSAMLDTLKSFYGVLKAADQWLRFVLLTGVTKFSKVSVFSDLNQLRDISMEDVYGTLCGITEQELEANFRPELEALAEKQGQSYGDALAEMRRRYDGYHFSKNGPGVFNPFSVLSALANQDFGDYWFRTGTPTFLVNELAAAKFDLRDFSTGIAARETDLDDYRANGGNPLPILYQSGYLTIQGYNKQFRTYELGFPNGEVKTGFLENLLLYYQKDPPDLQRFMASNFVEDLQKGNVDGFMNRLRAFISSIPYPDGHETERYYQNILYVIFALVGTYVQAETQSASGRCDLVVRTGVSGTDTVYVFEVKFSRKGSTHTAREALEQIDDKGYAIPYTASGCALVKIGAVFDQETRTLSEWETVS
ncbi:MAG: ATP-binding protein [Treponema sp.]|jgi:hypothetical protein|nr:ATP-binding protein [Treponema sp.]